MAEIGVHHDKLFLALQLTLRQDEQGLAIDLFEQQDLNVDRSGRFSLRSEADRHVSQLKAYVKTRPALAAFARKVTGREK